jgi:hypothetical protein
MLSFIVARDGRVRTIYADAALPFLQALGPVSIVRASHVEPTPHCTWTADMSPVGGPLLKESATRAAALAAEREWLLSHEIPVPLLKSEDSRD